MTLALLIGALMTSRLIPARWSQAAAHHRHYMLTAGLALFSRVHVDTSYVGREPVDVLGMSLAFIPSTISATTGVALAEAGIASAIVNTARMFGGALGIAVLATLATSHSNHVLRHPTAATHTLNPALVSGYDLGFLVGACMAGAGILVAAFATPNRSAKPAVAKSPPVQAEPPAEVIAAPAGNAAVP